MKLSVELLKITNKISYSDIFKYPTIKQLSGNIKNNEYFDLTKFTNTKIEELLKNDDIFCGVILDTATITEIIKLHLETKEPIKIPFN